jgi:GT2 family glycosyltransferase
VTPPVTVLVLTWNGLGYTRRCLESLRRLTAFDRYEVLVVDNGSTDGTPEYVESLGWPRLVRNPENLGFVRGNNIGMRQSDPRSDVLLLNNDVEIIQADWLARLQEAAYSDPAIGVVGCRQVLPDGLLLHAGTTCRSTRSRAAVGRSRSTSPVPADARRGGIVFACAYLKRAVLERWGCSTRTHLVLRDAASVKARAAGFRWCCGAVTLIHNEHGRRARTRPISQLLDASRQVFRRKWQKRLAQRYDLEVGWHSIMNVPTGYRATAAISCWRSTPPGRGRPTGTPTGRELRTRPRAERERPLPAERHPGPAAQRAGAPVVTPRRRLRAVAGARESEYDARGRRGAGRVVRQANQMDEVQKPSTSTGRRSSGAA